MNWLQCGLDIHPSSNAVSYECEMTNVPLGFHFHENTTLLIQLTRVFMEFCLNLSHVTITCSWILSEMGGQATSQSQPKFWDLIEKKLEHLGCKSVNYEN